MAQIHDQIWLSWGRLGVTFVDLATIARCWSNFGQHRPDSIQANLRLLLAATSAELWANSAGFAHKFALFVAEIGPSEAKVAPWRADVGQMR